MQRNFDKLTISLQRLNSLESDVDDIGSTELTDCWLSEDSIMPTRYLLLPFGDSMNKSGDVVTYVKYTYITAVSYP